MVKGRVAPPKCLFHVGAQIEKDRYTLIEKSAHLVLLEFRNLHLPTEYSYITSS